MPGLGASFGRGAATTFQRDLANSDCILIMGSNMAEAHPVGFRWALKARERGAPLIHVDPRFTRTSALADLYVQIRAGSDVAFLGGLINYVIEQGRWFRDYVLHYTNAATILSDEFRDAEDLDGVFAGLDSQTGRYERAPGAWDYSETRGPGAGVATDPSLGHPRCVFQVLRRHFARYTPEMVSEICGCAADDVARVAELLCRNSGPERTSAVVYALGWTQHSTGVQMIRAAAILQLLLGNIGRPGGGIMAMRGHCSVQGSSDIPTLYDVLPGYLPQPAALPEHATLESYLRLGRGFQSALENAAAGFWYEDAAKGYWSNLPKFMVSLLKAWYGDAARSENGFAYSWLPKYERDYSQLVTFFRMARGELKGLFLIGQNPAAGAPNAQLNRAALRNLDWLVVRDWFEHESANFWYADPAAGNPKEIKTEVFFLPAAAAAEKEGTFTNTERLLQWHEKAASPPGDCRSDAWFIYHLGRRLKELYASSTRRRDAPIRNLTWDYGGEKAAGLAQGSGAGRMADEPDIEKILGEINGWDVTSGRPLRSFAELKADGSTACGAWIYCGVQPEPGPNRARSRDPALKGGQYPNWGFAWPANRRIMYNRASAAPDGRPWSERKKLIWWNSEERRWTGYDEPDFEPTKAPDYRPASDACGMDAIPGDAPFIMHPDGRGWLFAPFGVKDGPLPVHYEPRESPLLNALHRTQANPTLREYPDPLNALAPPADPKYPIIATTYRLTEHYLSGPMSRFNSWLNELQPEMFVELSPELASERGIEHGGWMVVSTPRGRIEARAMVTRRLKPLAAGGRTVHQIGLPIHWGYAGETVGAIANDLTSLLTDVNVSMHEAKAFTCDIAPGRLSGVRSASPLALAPPYCDELVPETAEEAQPEGHQRPRAPLLRRAADAVKSAGQEFSATGAVRLIEGLIYPFRRAAPVATRAATGFFTDITLCIGCKACEVACKQWNQLPADGFKFTGLSYDNTAALSATTWRHVAFVERFAASRDAASGWGRWLMMSDVCKHCSIAPCHMACPTGAIVVTEFSNVYIQRDICNGCGYCVAACPFGVITRSDSDGVAHKCTLCLDRQRDGLAPACAKACPTGSIQFGPIVELRARAEERIRELNRRGITDAYLYGAEPTATYSPTHAFFLLREQPSVYGLPDQPLTPQLNMRADYIRSAASTVLWLAALIATLILYG